jgi:hypothetical protein
VGGSAGTSTVFTAKGHGTAMLSIVAGSKLGVAKRVTPILARVPRGIRGVLSITAEDWLRNLKAINDDLDKHHFNIRGQPASAVVLMAIYYPRRLWVVDGVDNSLAVAKQWAAVLSSMVEKGAILVTGSGNDDSPVDGIPAGFASQPPINNWPYISELLVAGGVNIKDNSRYFGTNIGNGIPNIWAPGESIIVASGNKAGWNNPFQGPEEFGYGPYNDGSRGTSEGISIVLKIRNRCLLSELTYLVCRSCGVCSRSRCICPCTRQKWSFWGICSSWPQRFTVHSGHFASRYQKDHHGVLLAKEGKRQKHLELGL